MAANAVLLIELGSVVLLLGILARGAQRIGLSPIPLYLVTGLALGEGGIVPLVTSEGFIETGATVGMIFLLLVLGLEYTASELMSSMRTVAPAGMLDLLLNALPGIGAGLLLGWGLPAALFLGGVTYISSSGVVAKLLADLGWSANSETPVVLSLLVFEDLAMAVFLPLLAALSQDLPVLTGAVTVAGALVAVAAAVLFAHRRSDLVGRIVFSPSDEASLLTLFGAALVVGGLAEQIHVSAAVGAFLVGLAVSGPAADQARRVLTPLRDFFAGLFFLFFGLRIDPGSLVAAVPVGVGLAVVGAGTKVAVGRWAASRIGVGRAGRRRAGLALIARGEFSIVVAGLAPFAGVAEVAAVFVLVTAVGGPVLARVAVAR